MLLYILSGLCLALSVFFGFVLVGYRTLAILLFALAVLLIVFRLCSVKKLRKTRLCLCGLLAVCLILFVVLEIPIVSASRGDENPEADYLIVLGAGVNGSVPSLSMMDRLAATLDYLERYPMSVAVVSGGQGVGENFSEAQVMFDWLVSRGVDPERVLMEDQATSTYENLAFSLRIIDQQGKKDARIAVCSSEYHLCRAKYLGQSLGVALLGVPAKTSLPVLKLNYFIREAFGMAYYRVF